MAARARRCGSGQAAINEIDLVANAGVLWHTISANFPAISRFTRCSVPLPTPTSVATLRIPLPALGVLIVGGLCWRTQSRPATTLPRMICHELVPLSCSQNAGHGPA